MMTDAAVFNIRCQSSGNAGGGAWPRAREWQERTLVRRRSGQGAVEEEDGEGGAGSQRCRDGRIRTGRGVLVSFSKPIREQPHRVPASIVQPQLGNERSPRPDPQSGPSGQQSQQRRTDGQVRRMVRTRPREVRWTSPTNEGTKRSCVSTTT